MDDTSSILRQFEDESVEAVSLLKEGIAFELETGFLTCLRLPSLQVDGRDLAVKGPEWFQGLWACVGEHPRDAALREGKFVFNLGPYAIVIDLDAADHFDPESAILSLNGVGTVVL